MEKQTCSGSGFRIAGGASRGTGSAFGTMSRDSEAGGPEPTLRVDAEVSGHEIRRALYEALQTLAPFGCANPAPVLAAHGSASGGGTSNPPGEASKTTSGPRA